MFYYLYICSTPLHRKDKSRMNAQSRRTTHAQLLKELGSLLPFPAKVVQQIDYNSILRLVLCYFRMKNLAIQDGGPSSTTSMYLTIINIYVYYICAVKFQHNHIYLNGLPVHLLLHIISIFKKLIYELGV